MKQQKIDDRKQRSLHEDLALIWRACKHIHKISPGFISKLLCIEFFRILQPFANIYMTAFLLNELAGARRVDHLIVLTLITVVSAFVLHLTASAFRRGLTLWWFKFYQDFGIYNNLKMTQLDYASIEDPAVHKMFDRYAELLNKTYGGLPAVANCISAISANIFMLLFSLGLTIEFLSLGVFRSTFSTSPLNSPAVLLLIVISIVILCAVRIWFGIRAITQREAAVSDILPFKRIFRFYTNDYIGDYHTGKDIRLYQEEKLITEDMMSGFAKTVKAIKWMNRGTLAEKISHSFVSRMMDFGVYLLVALRAAVGCFSIGNVLKYAEGILRFSGAIVNIVANIGYLRAKNDCLEAMFAYLDLPNRMEQGDGAVRPDADGNYTFEFRHVSFRYPDTDTYALKDINLSFKTGERIAVVGMNGSGKSTFIKLLCRMYDPTEGEILLNGVNIRTLTYQEYLTTFAVVFQDFHLFALSLGANVGVSVQYDRVLAEECLRSVGFGERLDAMPNGLDTYLYREFDENGVEISGGEAQKIALARALYQRAPILILDEPTASLDPVAEFEIYDRFQEIVGERTAIFISHRLSSCRFCRDILVFDEGRLIQRGDHKSLTADTHGKYYELWHAQAQYYS